MTTFSPGAQYAEVPVFPLPHVFLFPGAVMPLHIFEPRYRAMTQSALSSDRLICMANIVEDAAPDESGNPAIARIAGLGEIVNHEKLADGRYYLLLQGRCRVHLKELEFRPPYRRACAAVLASTGEEPSETERIVLRAAIQQNITRERETHPDFAFEYPETIPTSQLVDLCGQHLIEEVAVRQRLFETLDVEARLQSCIEALLGQSASSKQMSN
jgi:Lon protease-like protein